MSLFFFFLLQSLLATGLVDLVEPTNRGFGIALAMLTGLLDSVRPYGLALVALFIGFLILHTHNRRRSMFLGFIFVLVVSLSNFIIGIFGQETWQSLLQWGGYRPFHLVMGTLLVILLGILGITHFEEFLLNRKFFLSFESPMRRWTREFIGKYALLATILLALASVVFLFPITEHEYVGAFIPLTHTFGAVRAVLYLCVYQLFFQLPLVITLAILLRIERHVREHLWHSDELRWLKLVKSGLQLISAAVLFWALYYA